MKTNKKKSSILKKPVKYLTKKNEKKQYTPKKRGYSRFA